MLLLRDVPLLHHRGISFRLLAGMRQLRPLPGQSGFRSFESGFERAGIDGKKQVPRLYFISFFKVNRKQLTTNPRSDEHRCRCLDIANGT